MSVPPSVHIEIVGMIVLRPSTVVILATYLVLMVPKDSWKIGNEKYIKIMKQSSWKLTVHWDPNLAWIQSFLSADLVQQGSRAYT